MMMEEYNVEKRNFFQLFSLLFLVSSCAYFNNPADKRNVLWEDEEGILSFSIQGQSKTSGFARMVVNGETINGSMSIDTKYRLLIFTQKAYDMEWVSIRDTAFLDYTYDNSSPNLLHVILRSNDAIIGALNNKKLTLKRTDIPKDELDARYFEITTWKDSSNKLLISNNYTRGTIATFASKQIDFAFLENRRFSLTILNIQKAKGTYISNEDGSIELIVEEGASGLGLGNRIKMKAYRYEILIHTIYD